MDFHIPKTGLTKKNYYSPQNLAISNSKVRDFVTSKELFYGRHLDHSIPPDTTAAMNLGKYVDSVVECGSLKKFQKQYMVKVLKKDDEIGFAKQKLLLEKDPDRVISEETYAKVVRMSDKILRSPFYKEYKKKKAKFQVPLWNKFETWALSPDSSFKFAPGTLIPEIHVCGLLDTLVFDHATSTVYIDDLKTTKSASMKNPQSWYYKCVDFGYLRQLAFYRWMVMQAYPEFDNYVCRHVVISNEKTDLYPLKLFIIPNEMLVKPLEEFFTVAYQIATEESFLDVLPSWSDAETLAPFHPTQQVQEMFGDDELTEM